MSIEKVLRSFLEHKKKLDDAERQGTEATSEQSYLKEFTKLRELSATYKTENIYPSTEGEKNYNVPKNRYKDIVPFDYNRVKLKTQKDGSTSDYINASYMRGAVGDQMYIAAQGPMPKTVNEFWEMIWENDVRVIFTACNEYEGDPKKLKCKRYWPSSAAEEMTFGDIKVTLEKEETTKYKDQCIRHMVGRVGSESHTVVQFHYQEWPDKGVPRCIPGILDLIENMRNQQSLDAKSTPPIIVHCSAGCGRTGTILVIDFVQSLLKYGKLTGDFSLFNIIAEMRKQRMAIVQSVEQYSFVHDVIAEVFEDQLKLMDSTTYHNINVLDVKPQVPSSPEIQYELLDTSAKDKQKTERMGLHKQKTLSGHGKSPDDRSIQDGVTKSGGSHLEAVYNFALPVTAADPVYAEAYSAAAGNIPKKCTPSAQTLCASGKTEAVTDVTPKKKKVPTANLR